MADQDDTGTGPAPGERAPQDAQPRAEQAQLTDLATETAREVHAFVGQVRDLAGSGDPALAIPLLLLMLSSLQVTGARLGAVQDVVPDDRFEPDSGPDADAAVDAVRLALAELLQGVDEYTDAVDPVTSSQVERRAVSDDLAEIVAALDHGLAHYAHGRLLEALWWWQFSYLSQWGPRTSAVLRVLQTLLAHVRLDVDDDDAAEAQFDALHR